MFFNSSNAITSYTPKPNANPPRFKAEEMATDLSYKSTVAYALQISKQAVFHQYFSFHLESVVANMIFLHR